MVEKDSIFLNEIEIYEKSWQILSRFTIILELLSDIYKVILAVVSCLMIVVLKSK